MFRSHDSQHRVSRKLRWQLALGFLLSLYAGNLSAAQVSLAWDPSASVAVGGYRLHYGQASGTYTASVDVGNQTSYTLVGLGDGQIYFFVVTAYDVTYTVESGFSNEVSITTPPAWGGGLDSVAVPALSFVARAALIGLVFFIALLKIVPYRRG